MSLKSTALSTTTRVSTAPSTTVSGTSTPDDEDFSYFTLHDVLSQIAPVFSPETTDNIKEMLLNTTEMTTTERFLVLASLNEPGTSLMALFQSLSDHEVAQLSRLAQSLGMTLPPCINQYLLSMTHSFSDVLMRTKQFIHSLDLLTWGTTCYNALREIARGFAALDMDTVRDAVLEIQMLPHIELGGSICTRRIAEQEKIAFSASDDKFHEAMMNRDSIQNSIDTLEAAADMHGLVAQIAMLTATMPDVAAFPADVMHDYIGLVQHHAGSVLKIVAAYDEISEIDSKILDLVESLGKQIEPGAEPGEGAADLEALLQAARQTEDSIQQTRILLTFLLHFDDLTQIMDFFSPPEETREWRAQHAIATKLIEDLYTGGNAVANQFVFEDEEKEMLKNLCRNHGMSFASRPSVATALGDGGQGQVFTGTLRGETIVFKRPDANNIAIYPPSIMEFLKEGQNLSKHGGDYIISSHGLLVTPHGFYLGLEHCELGDASTYLKLGSPEASWELADILSLALQMALGVASFSVKGVIHRDLKPQNFLMTSKGSPIVRVKVGDLGNLLHISNATLNNIGTVGFTAPELIDGRDYDPKADVFSLAVTFWCMLHNTAIPRLTSNKGTAVHPMQIPMLIRAGERPLIAQSIPEPVAELIRQMWATDPDERPCIHTVSTRLATLCADLGAHWFEAKVGGVEAVLLRDRRSLLLRDGEHAVSVDLMTGKVVLFDAVKLKDPRPALQALITAIEPGHSRCQSFHALQAVVQSFDTIHSASGQTLIAGQLAYHVVQDQLHANGGIPMPVISTMDGQAMCEIMRIEQRQTIIGLTCLGSFIALLESIVTHTSLSKLRKKLKNCEKDAHVILAVALEGCRATFPSRAVGDYTVYSLGPLQLVSKGLEVDVLPPDFTPAQVISEKGAKFFIGDTETYACGDNRYGRLGVDCVAESIPTPKLVQTVNIKAVSVDHDHCFFLTDTSWAGAGLFRKDSIARPLVGAVIAQTADCEFFSIMGETFARGDNASCRLGTANTDRILKGWSRVTISSHVRTVLVTPHNAFFATPTGVYATGCNTGGQVTGVPTVAPSGPRLTPLPVAADKAWTTTAGIFVRAGGNVFCSGSNAFGQLLTDNTEPQLFGPVAVPLINELFVSESTTFALTSSGLVAAGSNSFGRLGLNSDSIRVMTPTLVDLDCAIATIYPGPEQTFLVGTTSDGPALFAAGKNEFGQTGVPSGNVIRGFTRIDLHERVDHIINDRKSTLFHTPKGVFACGCNRHKKLIDANKRTLRLTLMKDWPIAQTTLMVTRTIFLTTPEGKVLVRGHNKQGCTGLGHKKHLRRWTELNAALPFDITRVLSDGVVSYFEGADGLFVCGENRSFHSHFRIGFRTNTPAVTTSRARTILSPITVTGASLKNARFDSVSSITHAGREKGRVAWPQ
ncbi:Protein kinase domain [Carpediemonas membranifera]|uniref:Protein kinase domain n=1 Tax=Carpediemonas membranifera TaxID=201153 RepID=A0A8J6B7F0_9EUKA|nr:Protein kinase domain [Carpediemonas membranifera]|eukprot:KAG9391572.1 Protein kinase domain [Carpediemonas membranifera]